MSMNKSNISYLCYPSMLVEVFRTHGKYYMKTKTKTQSMPEVDNA